ncbi:asparagine synthase (glutamine-hydrolyzing) [soil metagenome]
MCGIVGVTQPGDLSPERFSAMVDCMSRRGPDARGEFRNADVALGHRRLSVIDLSERGAQPMLSDDGAVAIIYNGECYNHLELRAQLKGVAWKSDSDTETLLQLYLAHGHRFINEVLGMFALAIYDGRSREVLLYRDRAGEKPLYYHQHRTRLIFASDIQSILKHPDVSKDIDEDALGLYFLHNYIPAPRTIFRGIRRLLPGTFLRYSLASGGLDHVKYWDPQDHAEAPRLRLSFSAATDRLRDLVLSAVESQTISDVPLGCLLSGGVDSSLIAAALAKCGTGKVQTFSIGFSEAGYDEPPHAAAVAAHLGTEHHAQNFTWQQAIDVLPNLAAITGEPFADASILPMALLAKFAREHVTVALSGDGGDELFLGYNRYRWAEKVERRMRFAPRALRKFAAHMAGEIPHYRTQTIAHGLRYDTTASLYAWVFTGWNLPFAEKVMGRRVADERMRDLSEASRNFPTAVQGGLLDFMHYLPDDILFKVDRAAMHSSLETRVPLLDRRVAEFALSLPIEFCRSETDDKIILKNVLKQFMPEKLFNRPKAGFAVPLKTWFRGPLKKMTEELLSPEKLRGGGPINSKYVQEILAKHSSGKWNYERQIFALVVFQLWKEQNFS